MLTGLFRSAWRQKPEVTICIPAWQAEPFIERTLHCARAQTHRRVRILISVDGSEDATAEICHAHARADRRIDVLVQKERLGWARNANALLDRVDTPFYFLYFHDDILEPAYTERLLDRIRGRSDAAGAYCDMGTFGGNEDVKIGPDYEGSAVERLCMLLLSPTRGSPLRALIRTSAVGALRLPTDAPDGLWANEPYLMQLVAAGPLLRVPEVLYRRWDKRKGGLTDGWKNLTREQVVAGYRANAEKLLAVVDDIAADTHEREILRFAVYVFILRRKEAASPGGEAKPINPAELSPLFAKMHLPRGLSHFSPDIQRWGQSGFDVIRRRVLQADALSEPTQSAEPEAARTDTRVPS